MTNQPVEKPPEYQTFARCVFNIKSSYLIIFTSDYLGVSKAHYCILIIENLTSLRKMISKGLLNMRWSRFSWSRSGV